MLKNPVLISWSYKSQASKLGLKMGIKYVQKSSKIRKMVENNLFDKGHIQILYVRAFIGQTYFSNIFYARKVTMLGFSNFRLILTLYDQK